MMDVCLKSSNVTCAYIGLTRDSAKNVILPHLKEIKKNFGVKCRFYKSPASVQFPNGSTILFFGINDTEEEREKLLGQHFKLAAIDEGASYTIDLKTTIKDFIEPTLWDDDGQLIIIGTPGNLRNYFCDITEGRVPGWSNHFWLTDKNPKTRDKYLQEITEKRRLYPNIDQDPGFQQHYLAKWTIDTDRILYKYQSYNLINDFKPKYPIESYTYVLGMDLGWTDQNAFVVGAYHPHDGYMYLLNSYSEANMLMDMTINKIHELKRTYPISVYVIDSANKAYVEEMRYRTRIPFQAATKPEKMKYIHMMNSDLILNKIQIVEPNCQSLLQEYQSLTKLEESNKYETAVGNQIDHNSDAALYIYGDIVSIIMRNQKKLNSKLQNNSKMTGGINRPINSIDVNITIFWKMIGNKKELLMKIETLQQLEEVIQLAMQHKLEILEIDNIKIVKTKHDYFQPLSNQSPRTLDDELFGNG